MVLVLRKGYYLIVALLFLSACSSRTNLHKYEFQDGYYAYRQEGGSYHKVYVTVLDDSVHVVAQPSPIQVKPAADQTFMKHSLDFDILTVPFKYRPGIEPTATTPGLPRQLTANINGNAMLGWRMDRFKIVYKQTPAGFKKYQLHRGVSLGGFVGLGSAAVTPWTTNQLQLDEYEGLVLTRGLAAMIGVNNLTFGLGVGWDYLTDRDRSIWIYQNKPWYGVSVGLNLN